MSLETLRAENARLRVLLAMAHCSRLYTDDGELQDNSAFPSIDFKRDTPDMIVAKLRERNLALWSRLISENLEGLRAVGMLP